MNRMEKLIRDEKKNPYFSLKTASERLGWSPVTLRKRLTDGSIFGNKIGRKWIIPRSEIERLLTTR